MPATMELKENGRIICFTLTGDWTVQEVLDLDAHVVNHLRRSPYRVHLLVNISQTDAIPQHYTKLSKSARFAEPNLGYTAVVSDIFGLQLLSELVGKLVNYNKSHYFRSLEVAYRFLRTVIQQEHCSEGRTATLGH